MNEKLESLIQKRIDVSLPVAIGVGILTLGGGLVVGYIVGRFPGRPKPLSEEDQDVVDSIQDGMAELRAKKDIPRVDLSALRDEKNEQSSGVVIDAETYKTIGKTKDGENIILLHDPGDLEPYEEVTVDHETVRRNVFAEQADPEDDWDYDVEMNKRQHSNGPYVIHRDEFFEEDDETESFQQRQLTWYNGDGVLVDEERTPVYNHRDVVGELKFGHGSGDPNVVYVRNERLKAEYEIWLDSSRYDVEVQGADMEDVTAEDIRHAHSPRKFRLE